MRRQMTISTFGRRVANVAAVGSLALSLTVMTLWTRSYWKRDAVEFIHADARWDVASEFGRLRVSNNPQLLYDLKTLASVRQAMRESVQNRRAPPGAGAALAAARRAGREAIQYEYAMQLAEQRSAEAAFDAAVAAEREAVARVVAIPGMPPPPVPQSYGVPHWVVALVAAVPAAHWGWWMRLRRRRAFAIRRGLCPECGYDVRATPERCPECGTASTVTTTIVAASA
jgi:hypothetical protein